MRILGLDIGDKRIGVAISDGSGTIAKPLTVIKNNTNAGSKLSNIIKDYNIGKIVVGIPYTLKGQIGFQAKKVIDFIDNIVKKLELQVIYIDERFTSKISKNTMMRKKKAGEIDKVSACIILSDYLNSEKKRL